MQSEDWKRELCEVFFAQSRVILWTTVVVFALAVIIVVVWPPTYQAAGSVLLRDKRAQESPDSLEKTELRKNSVSKEDVISEAEVLNSPELTRRALAQLAGQPIPAAGTPADPLVAKQVQSIRKKMKTTMVPSSNVIKITLCDRDAKWAESFLDALLNQYIGYRAGLLNPVSQEAFLAERAKLYKDKMEELENRLLEQTRKTSVTMAESEMENNVLLKKELEQRLNLLRDEYLAKEKQVAAAQLALTEENVQFYAFLDNKPIDDLSIQLMNLMVERGKAARFFQAGSSKVKEMDDQIRDTFTSVRNEAQNILIARQSDWQGLKARIKSVEDAIQEISARNVTLKEQSVEIQRLSREMALIQYSYETFARRTEEARITGAIAAASLSGDVSILSRAAMSAEKVFPIPWLTLLLGLVAGFITGCSFGFISEYFDRAVKRPGDVTRSLQMPVIGSIRMLE